MKWLTRLPIRRQILIIIVTTCSMALLLACIGLGSYELVDFRRASVQDTSALADIVGSNCRAGLSFDDPEAAKNVLSALTAEPGVVNARVYRASGTPFADFIRAGSMQPISEAPPPDGHAFTKSTLRLVRPITLEDHRIGTIAITTSLARMYERLAIFAGISVLVLLGSLLVAVAGSSWLQRPVSQPILALSELARTVAERKDYGVRAPAQDTANEVGALTEAFNQMLTEIQRHADGLASTNAELQQFAYITSHDLKEPLRMVTVYMGVIEKRLHGRLDDRDREYFGFAVEGAKRMHALIHDLMAFTRASHSHEPNELVDLNQMLHDVVAVLQEEIAKQQGEVTIAPLPTVLAARTKLALVFQNLIGNALKFHRPTVPPRVDVSCTRNGVMWDIAVSDNGIGIDSKYHELVFAVFQRLHGRDEFPGNGMGLAISRKIIEQHHGHLLVRSNGSTGSTFVVQLPVESAPRAGVAVVKISAPEMRPARVS